jgi:hypothetical protein
MRRKSFSAFAFAAAVLAAPATASTVIDFESFTAMNNSPGSAVPVASQLSNQLLSSLGVKFSSLGGYVAVVNHVPGCPACTPSPPNIIGGTAADGTLSYSAPITASFFSTANPSVKRVTNFVTVAMDKFPLGSGSATLEVYGVSGNLLAAVSAPDTGPIGTPTVLGLLNVPGIHSVRFFSDNATVGFDDFTFGTLTGIPEPASWAMLIAGFGLVGAVARRKAWALEATRTSS